MKVSRLFSTRKLSGVFRLKVLLLCSFFALGILLGGVVHSAINGGEDQQLREYLLQFTQLAAQPEDMTGTVIAVLITYLRYPLLIVLCGFMAAGVVLIPVLCAVQGFFLSFAVHSFTSALGRNGVQLALCAFGLRSFFALPCTLFLAMHAVTASVQLLHLHGEGRRKERPVYGSAYFMRIAVCVFVMLVGVVLELSVVPKLLLWALGNMT